jgi:hypothetical protein
MWSARWTAYEFVSVVEDDDCIVRMRGGNYYDAHTGVFNVNARKCGCWFLCRSKISKMGEKICFLFQ